ncbi:MAG: metalloregulator ArsR/SmtB family transcription factor [bacterium]|nr:winged helix-turn-helix transcriptional regulator [bacterium]
MVKYTEAELSRTFSALSDPTRRGILRRLADGSTTVSELAGPYSMSLPAVSKHLKVLEEAGLVSRDKQGREYHCRLLAGPLREAMEWIAFYRGFWHARIDSLEDFLASDEQNDNDGGGAG